MIFLLKFFSELGTFPFSNKYNKHIYEKLKTEKGETVFNLTYSVLVLVYL
jgi:hypothetical protein